MEIASTSTAFSFWPSRMIEPLPQARSICEIAASSAFSLSTSAPSTRRSATFSMDVSLISQPQRARKWRHCRCPLAPSAPAFRSAFHRLVAQAEVRPGGNVHVLFSVRNLFFSARSGWPGGAAALSRAEQPRGSAYPRYAESLPCMHCIPASYRRVARSIGREAAARPSSTGSFATWRTSASAVVALVASRLRARMARRIAGRLIAPTIATPRGLRLSARHPPPLPSSISVRNVRIPPYLVINRLDRAIQ